MTFPKGVTACGQGNGFFVVHGHAGKGFPDIPSGAEGIGLSVGTFWVHIDQAHLDCAEGLLEFAIASVAFVSEPSGFGAPINVVFGFPDIFASAAKAEGFEPHRFEGDVTCEDKKIGPRELVTVFFLDRPEEAAGFIEIDVIGPAVEGGKTLIACACSASAIRNPVRSCAVPSHANEEGTVVAPIGRPPLL